MDKAQLVKLALKKRDTKGVAMSANPFPDKNSNTDVVKKGAGGKDSEEQGESKAFEASENESSENANNAVNSLRKKPGTKATSTKKKVAGAVFWKSSKRG
jgi:hypothetical protein